MSCASDGVKVLGTVDKIQPLGSVAGLNGGSFIEAVPTRSRGRV
jgi:hypothetical protein